jgi:hypothetical protein
MDVNTEMERVSRDKQCSRIFLYLVHGKLIVKACMMSLAMIGMLVLTGLASFSYLKVSGGEQEEEQPTISICQEELNETKCNQIEPVCPETFPGCVGNSSSSSSKP